MEKLVYDNEKFDGLNLVETSVKGREFQSCSFKKCDLSNSRFLNCKFIDCVFEGCNLSLIKLGASYLNNVAFKDCKLLGINFNECQSLLFTVGFNNCLLDYSSFMGRKMPGTRFIRSSLKETTFSEANISGGLFDDCNLAGTIFNRTDLSGADLTTSYNYDIDPEINNIRKAAFSANGIHGLLRKYNLKIT
jgi:fluoroquinolone resistance protein